MPRTRQVDVAHPSPVSHPLRPFVFPAGHHLVIATPCGIYSWDSTGLVQIFNSSKKGILAAKEANDGSQLLAVADKHNVVLHDCKRERNESWGLIGDEGQVRLLEYAPDAKSLFLSTSLTGAIQCYSMHESRLLDPAQTHPTPPTVLAVSSATHLMLSASDDPPVVYLQNLTLKTPALQLHPSASSAAVVAASFHPQRPNVFLLAFKDGTLAAYDATQMARRNGARMDVNATIETNGRAGEIAHLSKLHRITTRAAVDPNRVLDAAALGGDDDGTKTAAVGSKSMGITGAAFLTGYRSRALSVGGDGRCRLVDFEGGGKILRTWHAQAPVTSLSILAVEEERGAGIGNVDGMGAPGRRQRRATANNLIAVGRADGKVCLFDSVGLKLDMMVIDNAGERVISVEWIKGPSPKAMSSLPIEEMAEGVKANPTKAIRLAGQTDVPLQYETASGLPSALQGSILQSLANTSKLLAEPVMTGALPPDNPATVRHTPAAASAHVLYGRLPTTGGNYLDLFSPVKQKAPPTTQSLRHVVATHPRVSFRPRLSSHTFVAEEPSDLPGTATRTHNLTLHPLGAPLTAPCPLITETPPKPPLRSILRDQQLSSAAKVAKERLRRDFGRKPPSSSDSTTRTPRLQSASKRNGQLLAELRRLGGKDGKRGARRKSGNVALFAPYMTRTGISNLPRSELGRPNNTHSQGGNKDVVMSEREPARGVEDEREIFDSASHSSDRDIWLTATSLSENDDLAHRQRQRRRRHRTLHRAQSSNKHGDCSRQHPDFPPNAEELDVRSGANPTSFKRAEHVQAAKIVLEDSPDAQKKPLKARLTHYTTAPLVLPPSQAAIAAPSSGLNVGEEEVNAEGKVSAASGRVHSPKATRPWLAKQVLSATSDEGMTTAREYISPVDQAFSPESTEVRQLFPRSSSLSPRREKSAVGAEKGNSENRDGRAKLAVLGHNTINARRKQPEDLERQNAATAAAFALLGSAKAPSRPGAATKPCRGPPGGVPAALNASLPGPSDPPRSQPQKGHKAHSASARHATTKQQSQPQPGTRATTTTQSKRPTTSFVDGAPTIAGTDFGLPRDERGLVHDTMSDAAPAARRDECDACPALRAQVRDLDDQVARLRAEVLGLRTRLRRVGG